MVTFWQHPNVQKKTPDRLIKLPVVLTVNLPCGTPEVAGWRTLLHMVCSVYYTLHNKHCILRAYAFDSKL